MHAIRTNGTPSPGTPDAGTHLQPSELGWLEVVRVEVEAYLEEFFECATRDTTEVSPPTLELVEQIAGLTLRGGKRLRGAVAAAGYRCVRPGQGADRIVELGAALELLQSYLLIHDDWMDGDAVRRGAPAVHAALAERHGHAQLGASLGVLAGDLAFSYAWEIFLRAPYPQQAWPAAHREFLRTQKEVYCGQHLDLIGDDDVARMHALKTTSYSVRGPLLLGALLGNPTETQIEALSSWAAPIGEAFQIRDDLLGALGSADATGKPALDIPHGKRSSVVDELRRSTSPAARIAVDAIHGRGDAADEELDAARACLRDTGVVDRLETRITALRQQALDTLDRAPFNPQGRHMLTELATRLTERGT